MKITLVRHGQTESNYKKIIQGRNNVLLNDEGRRQCQKLKAKLAEKSFDYCYMSPLGRTVETAIILVGDRVETRVDERITEREMGELVGKDRSLYNMKKYWDYKENCGDLGVEKVQDIEKRCREFLTYIIKKYPDKNILIVTHASPLRMMRHILLNHNLEKNLIDNNIYNCYCEEIDVDTKKYFQNTKK